MSDGRRISVVIPAFQAAATIGDSVVSALQQDPQPAEVIVVDDGSTDATPTVLAEFGDDITVIRQANSGEGAARNRGLTAVDTEWVAYLDADDRFLPGRLAAVGRLLDAAPQFDIVTTDAFMEVAGEIAGRCYGAAWPFADVGQRIEILRRNFVFGHVIARAEDLRRAGGFEESISHGTDWAMWIRMILDGNAVGLVERPLSVYRLHAYSLSTNRLAMARGGLQSLRLAAAHPSLSTFEREVVAASIDRQMALIRQEELSAALRGQRGAVRHAAMAVLRGQRHPLTVRAKAGLAMVAPGAVAATVRGRHRGKAIGTTGRSVPVEDQSRPPTRGPVPLVSVVVPVDHDPASLRVTVESLRTQQMGAWELILVDDESATDPARLVARSASEADPGRTQLLPIRSGDRLPVWCRGVDACRAGAIAMVEPGDTLAPDALERRLGMFADCCEAGYVVDSSTAAQHPPRVIWPAGAHVGSMPERAMVLFRAAALRQLPDSLLALGVEPRLIAALGRVNPVVVSGDAASDSAPRPSGYRVRRHRARS